MRRLSRETFAVLEEVRESGEPVTLTKRGHPVGEIIPITPEDAARWAAETAARSASFMQSLESARRSEAREMHEFIDSLPPDKPRGKGSGDVRPMTRKVSIEVRPATRKGSIKARPATRRRKTQRRSSAAKRPT